MARIKWRERKRKRKRGEEREGSQE